MASDSLRQQIPLERPLIGPKGLAGLWHRMRWPAILTFEVGGFLLIWDFLIVRLQLVNPFFVPAPSNIWKELLGLIGTGELWYQWGFSVHNLVIGWAAGTVVGIALGLLIGTMAALDRLWGPIIWTLYATPLIILRPLFVIWFGFGWESLAFLIALGAVFPILITIVSGVHTVDESMLRMARVFGARRLQLYRKIILPSLVPYIFTGFRLSIAPSLIGMLVGEMVASNQGLGYIIQMGATHFKMSQSMVAVMVLVAMSLSLVHIVRVFEDRVAAWRGQAQGQ